MAVSMTGYGRTVKETPAYHAVAEIKTMNHRYKEFHFKLPQELSRMDIPFRQLLGTFFTRGRIELTVKLEKLDDAAKELQIDWMLIDSYYQFFDQARKRYGLQEEPALRDLANLEGAVWMKEQSVDGDILEKLVLDCVRKAAILASEMRSREGTNLASQLYTYTDLLEKQVRLTEEQAPAAMDNYIDKISRKIKDIAGNGADEKRVLEEAVFFADKADIEEELSRLKSHLSQFRETLASQSPMGRKLDFILQEMNREVNTVGSKSSSLDITAAAVEMKVFIEKMREQVQNIE